MPASTQHQFELDQLEQHLQRLLQLDHEGDVDASLHEALQLMGALARYRHRLKQQDAGFPALALESA
jgi:hypothetical protein